MGERRRRGPDPVGKALRRKGFHTLDEAAKAVGCARTTLYRALRKGITDTTPQGTVEALRATGLYSLALQASHV